MTAPHLPKIGVLALVPEPFAVPWMSRHQILTRLAAYYHVVWVNPARNWREVWREPSRPLKTEGASGASTPDNLIEYEPPPWLPQVHRPKRIERFFEAARLRAARELLIKRGCDTIVLYVWRPSFASALDRTEYDMSLYHVVDEYSFSDSEMPTSERELDLLTRADRVLIHSPGLFEKKGHLNAATSCLPNGVDFEAVSAQHLEPQDLAAITGPRIGYCGWLKKQIDWDLIGRLARRHTEWSFVFVGARANHDEVQKAIEDLQVLPNVHFLGAKSPEELLRYPAHFDVCIMPYQLNDYTKYIYPLKLHEYLACGRPVVATPIRTLLDFQDVVELAESVEEWSRALERALSMDSNSAHQRAVRIELARAHDWGRIAYQVASTIAEGVGGEAPQDLSAAPVAPGLRTPPPTISRSSS